MYELYTKHYIKALLANLKNSFAGVKGTGDFRVWEVAAGGGRLERAVHRVKSDGQPGRWMKDLLWDASDDGRSDAYDTRSEETSQ